MKPSILWLGVFFFFSTVGCDTDPIDIGLDDSVGSDSVTVSSTPLGGSSSRSGDGFNSPRQAFDAYVDAMANHDTAAYFACVAPERRAQTVGEYTVEQWRFAEGSPEVEEARDAVMAEYGVPSLSTLEKLDSEETQRKIGEMVKSPGEFMKKLFRAVTGEARFQQWTHVANQLRTHKVDIRVEEDKAYVTCDIPETHGDALELIRVNGRWYWSGRIV